MSIEFNDQKVSAIVLDFDGTFYSNGELQDKIWTDARLQLVGKIFESQKLFNVSAEKTEQMLKDYIERAEEIGWSEAFIEFGGEKKDYRKITDFVEKAEFLTYDQQLVDLLNNLMKYVPVYIFTGSSRETVLAALETLIGDLWTSFEDKLLTADDLKTCQKPQLEAYITMIKKFGIDPQTTVFVDDHQAEVATATELGMLTFLIQEQQNEETNINPHIILNSIYQLSEHLSFND